MRATYEDYEALFDRLQEQQDRRRKSADIDEVLRVVERQRAADTILRAEERFRQQLDPDVYVKIVNAAPPIHEASVPAAPRAHDDAMSNYAALIAIIMVLSFLLVVLFTVFCL